MINRHQIIAIITTVVALLAILVFPPFILQVEGEIQPMGYSFILNPPKQGSLVAGLNVSKLLIQWLVLMLYGGLALVLTRDPQPSFGRVKAHSAEKPYERYNPFPSHPWIRFWARSIDYALFFAIFYALIYALVLNGVPIRFSNSLLVEILAWSVVANALLIFCEAFCLSKFATTPGKALFSLRVLAKKGTKLSFSEALTRSFLVLFHGFAFLLFFPVLSILALWGSYKDIKETGVAHWDKKEKHQFAHGPLEDIKMLVSSVLGIVAAVALSLTPLLVWKIFPKPADIVPIQKPVQQAFEASLPPPAINKNVNKPNKEPILTPSNKTPEKKPPPPTPANIVKPLAYRDSVMPRPTHKPVELPKNSPPQYADMLEAVQAKDIPALKEFIRQGGNINERVNGTTLLIAAVKSGDTQLVRWLVEQGADTNQTDVDGRSPYLFAQITNNEIILSLLGVNNAAGASEILRWRHDGNTWTIDH